MTKRDLDLLGKLFAREVEGALRGLPGIYQGRHPERLAKLQVDGLVEYAKLTDGRHMTLEGWILTERGRMAYCASCKDETE